MENNLSQNEKQELEQRARRKLQQMPTTEIAKCARKEKIRTYWWLGISLYCCLAWGVALFTNDFNNEPENPIGGFIMAIIAGLAIAVFMVVKLFKKEDQLALIRIKREIKKEDKESLKKQKSQEFFKKLGFSKIDIEEGFVVSKIEPLGVAPLLPNQTINDPIGKILIDDKNKRVIFQKHSYYTKSFSFSDIFKYDIYENEQTVVQGRAGSALVGGLFFGVTGAIVGASRKRGVEEQVNILKIIIYVNDLECPKIEFTYVGGESLSRNSQKYIQIIKNLQEISSYLEYMINNVTFIESTEENSDNTTSPIPKKELSKKEQLEELKELLSDSLITQEDFEQKKKQILGL